MWIIGHRGASGHAPENTLAAFSRAVELGARFIETDLQLSRDSRLVAMHDDTLDRTTNGRGPVNRLTLAAVRRIEPTLMTGFLFQWPLEDAVDLAIRAGARQLAPHGDQVTPELVTAARRNNLQVVTWTINAPAQMRALISAGVDGIMTDYPDRLVAVMRE